MKIIIKKQLKIVIFTSVKSCCILHGRVFVMGENTIIRNRHIERTLNRVNRYFPKGRYSASFTEFNIICTQKSVDSTKTNINDKNREDYNRSTTLERSLINYGILLVF